VKPMDPAVQPNRPASLRDQPAEETRAGVELSERRR
jgi:hypothetical protein